MPLLFRLVCKDLRSLSKIFVEEDARAELGIGPCHHNLVLAINHAPTATAP